MRATRLGSALMVMALVVGQAAAFQWEPFAFPTGDQRYVLEVRTVAEGSDDQVSTITITITEGAEGYNVDTAFAFSQEGVSQDELSNVMFGGSLLGTFAFGPMMMFGPSFMMLPMMLMGEEIRVRAEPVVVMGMGRLHMDRTTQAAGRECVLLRFETGSAAEPSEDVMEFALAEDLPFPCYARYGSAGSYTEIRVLEAD